MRPSIAKRQCTVKKVLYVIVFDIKGPVMQLPSLKGRTVTGAFYKNVVLKKVECTLLRDATLKLDSSTCAFCLKNTPAHKERIVTEFVESEKMNLIISCFPNSDAICLEKDTSQEILLRLLCNSSSWPCLFRTMNVL